ncbi:hypothetical protein [Vibrio nomapromontoriensis]|uniref:hypothetical protein n=1 Tax=Vibrio nomapromontoriensis TaxID=2910246 RepID=UPI003D1186CA
MTIWKNLALSGAIALVVTGCANNDIGHNDVGYAWCNARYLDYTFYTAEAGFNLDKDKRFSLASKGYLYAIAADYSLQKDLANKDRHVKLPPYMRVVSELTVDKDPNGTGFEATTIEIYSGDDLREIVMAFTGSNDSADWGHNLKLMKSQFGVTEKYIDRVVEHYRDVLDDDSIKFVSAGYSLGGGLSMQALRYEKRVDEGWAFNPSPWSGMPFSVEDNQYLLAASGEILAYTRWIKKGPHRLGTLDENYSDNYNLIKANPFTTHSRWILTRQLLIMADLDYFEKTNRTDSPEPGRTQSPALKILHESPLPRGCISPYREELEAKGRLVVTMSE